MSIRDAKPKSNVVRTSGYLVSGANTKPSTEGDWQYRHGESLDTHDDPADIEIGGRGVINGIVVDRVSRDEFSFPDGLTPTNMGHLFDLSRESIRLEINAALKKLRKELSRDAGLLEDAGLSCGQRIDEDVLEHLSVEPKTPTELERLVGCGSGQLAQTLRELESECLIEMVITRDSAKQVLCCLNERPWSADSGRRPSVQPPGLRESIATSPGVEGGHLTVSRVERDGSRGTHLGRPPASPCRRSGTARVASGTSRSGTDSDGSPLIRPSVNKRRTRSASSGGKRSRLDLGL